MTNRIKAGGTISKAAAPGEVAQYASTRPEEIDLSLAGNPFGPSKTIQAQYQIVAQQVGHREGSYPRIESHLVAKLKAHHGIVNDPAGSENLLGDMTPDVYIGSGCTGIIQDIFNSGLVSSGEYLVVPASTFPVPAGFAAQNLMGINRVSLTNGLKIDFDQMRRAVEKTTSLGHRVSMIFLANPNNPTGYAESTSSIIKLANDCPESLVVVSEANIDYLSDAALKKIGGSLLDQQNIGKLPKNILVLRSFSKAYGMAEDRIGYAVGDKQLLEALRRKAAPFKMPARSLINAMIALDDPAYIVQSREHMEIETKKIAERLRALGFPNVTETDSNIFVARVPSYFASSDELAALLHSRGCAVVSCGAEFGRQLEGTYIRLSPSTADQNDKFIVILQEICAEKEAQYLAEQAKKPPCPLLSCILGGWSASSPKPPDPLPKDNSGCPAPS